MANHTTRQIGDTLEDYLQHRFSLQKTSGSGNIRQDNDLFGSLFSIEAKATIKDSIPIKLKTWKTSISEAQSHGKYPLYVLGFVDENKMDLKEIIVATSLDYLESILTPGTIVITSIVNKIERLLKNNPKLDPDTVDKVIDLLYSLDKDITL